MGRIIFCSYHGLYDRKSVHHKTVHPESQNIRTFIFPPTSPPNFSPLVSTDPHSETAAAAHHSLIFSRAGEFSTVRTLSEAALPTYYARDTKQRRSAPALTGRLPASLDGARKAALSRNTLAYPQQCGNRQKLLIISDKTEISIVGRYNFQTQRGRK